jgi:uncharacterized protein YegL
MTKANLTEIVIVLDPSGSMSAIAADMRVGFDTFMKDQRKQPGECLVTLAQFDERYEVVYTARPIADVPALDLVPRGSTALLDAVGLTIAATGERLKTMRAEDRPSKVLFVIITDGMENASLEYTAPGRIAEMTKHQRERYRWEFVYLGANQDAFAVAQAMGIMHNAVKYDASPVGTAALFTAASAGTSNYRSSTHATMDSLIVQSDYDDQLKQAAQPVVPTTTGPLKQ